MSVSRADSRVFVYCAGAVLLAYVVFTGGTLVHASRAGWVGLYLFEAQKGCETVAILGGGPAARQAEALKGHCVVLVDGQKPSSQWLRKVDGKLRSGDRVTSVPYWRAWSRL